MRAFFLLLIVAVAFLLVLRFYPTSDVEGAEAAPADSLPVDSGRAADGAPAAPVATRFLTRPEPEPELVAPEPSIPEVVVQDSDPASDTRGLPEWLAGIEVLPVAAKNELQLAAAILHGTPADVARELAATGDLSEDRRRLIQSFKLAVAGQRQQALDGAQEIGDAAGCTTRDRELLRAALRRTAPTARPAGAGREGLLEVAMEMALRDEAATAALAGREYKEAVAALSQLIVFELDAPWEAHQEALERWSAALDEAQRHHRWNPQGDWPGVDVEVLDGDSLNLIRKRFVDAAEGRIMCSGLIAEVNGVTRFIHPGQTLRIPTEPVSVLVCIDARWLVVFIGDEIAACWKVGVGRPGKETITGAFVVGDQQKNPTWFPPGREPVPYGDPRNPLGTRWIGWYRDGEKTSYGFHRTNDPESVGLAASDGCIRMNNADVEVLFRLLPLAAPIVVRD